MLITTSLLNKSLKTYNKTKNEDREGYSKSESLNAGMSAGFATGFLLIAVIFFVLELILLFYSVYIALKCTKPGAERVMHVVLATVFTLPYALISLTFNSCAKQAITAGYSETSSNSNMGSSSITY
jgi:hypothetical protein